MVSEANLQNQINTILGPKASSNDLPQIKPIAHVTADGPTVAASSQNQAPAPQTISTPPNFPAPAQTVSTPATLETPKVSQSVPPIQTRGNITQPTGTPTNQENNKIIPIVAVIILLILGLTALFIFRKSLFGPMTYTDCLDTPGNTHVGLEPKYCVTKDGEIFFENKNDLNTLKDDAVEATFNPQAVPTTDLPE